MNSHKLSARLDKAGIGVSLLCAIHCALLPLILAALPVLGLEFIASPKLELSIISLSILIGIYSLSSSWFRHKNFVPLLIMCVGFFCILSGHFETAARFEWALLGIGGMLVAMAHYLNWKAGHHKHHKHNIAVIRKLNSNKCIL